ncbi:reverse transcriptase domain-containing protein [Tanacetum coccineum]
MLKSLLSNKEKLIELANTPVSENCSAVIIKKLPEKLGDPGKFLILCGFNELKFKALADLGASINLMPLSAWKELGLPELISTRMTLELANRDIFTPKGIARDVFVLVGKFTFPADLVIVDYESDLRVLFILGRPFLRTARALIDVHGEEMILLTEDIIENLLNLDKTKDLPRYGFYSRRFRLMKILLNDNLDDTFSEMFTMEHATISQNFATPNKKCKKESNASLILEDFNPPLYELPFHKEVPGLGALLSFSPENEEKIYNPGTLTSKRVHISLLPELSHQGTKAFKVTKILESPMEIFPCSYQEDIRVLDVPCLHFYPP